MHAHWLAILRSHAWDADTFIQHINFNACPHEVLIIVCSLDLQLRVGVKKRGTIHGDYDSMTCVHVIRFLSAKVCNAVDAFWTGQIKSSRSTKTEKKITHKNNEISLAKVLIVFQIWWCLARFFFFFMKQLVLENLLACHTHEQGHQPSCTTGCQSNAKYENF